MTTTRLRLLIAGVLAGGIFTAACAQADPENNVATPPAESGSPSPTPRLSVVPSATPTKASTAGELTLTGMVERIDLEGGCLVLRADGGAKTYELKGGDPAVVKAGSRVIITGKVRSDLMTVCQVGPVLEVISSQPA